MSLSQQAISRAGLTTLVARRVHGTRPSADELEHASRVDLLALGAAADAVRRADVGDNVRLYLGAVPTPGESFVMVGPHEHARGSAFFRRVALARLMLPLGGRLCIDVATFGVELAQAALAFGASEWANVFGTRRGLPLASEAAQNAFAKRDELAGYIRRAGRLAVFVEASESAVRAAPSTTAPQA